MYFVWIDLSGDYSISIFYLKDPYMHRCLTTLYKPKIFSQKYGTIWQNSLSLKIIGQQIIVYSK